MPTQTYVMMSGFATCALNRSSQALQTSSFPYSCKKIFFCHKDAESSSSKNHRCLSYEFNASSLERLRYPRNISFNCQPQLVWHNTYNILQFRPDSPVFTILTTTCQKCTRSQKEHINKKKRPPANNCRTTKP